jgi:arabinan endo-1,5-alpha-L-arabinosidase
MLRLAVCLAGAVLALRCIASPFSPFSFCWPACWPARSEKVENANRYVHDPCIIKQGDTYYVFSTGHGIPIRRSKDLIHWEAAGRVFAEDVPKWAGEEIRGSAFPWAPDIAYLHGRYYLYYSVSTFGRNRSLIGLVTNRTLDPQSPDYVWKDEGKVVESFPQDGYNAIDSNVLALGKGKLAMIFGSFWSGIQYIEADARTGKPRPGAVPRCIARRLGSTAIEAPFLIRHGAYFYLLVSFDFCCRGTQSTYNIRIGRAKSVEGPYLDRDGKPMLEGGGTLLLGTEGSVIGPGHCAVLRELRRDLLVYHFYDGTANGIPTLQVRPLAWDRAGWPRVESPLDAGPESREGQ